MKANFEIAKNNFKIAVFLHTAINFYAFCIGVKISI